jgi:hypothetical protein
MIAARAAIPAGSPNIDRNQERAKPKPYRAGASSRWGALYSGDTVMLRKTMITLFAAASVIMLASTAASARGGFGGGGHHGGGWGGYSGGAIHGAAIGGAGVAAAAIGGSSGVRAVSVGNGLGRPAVIVGSGYRSAGFVANGFHGGHFRHEFHGRRFLVGAGLGYAYYDDYYDYPAYAYDDAYYGDGGCYLMQQRIHTRHGRRIRQIQVCG